VPPFRVTRTGTANLMAYFFTTLIRSRSSANPRSAPKRNYRCEQMIADHVGAFVAWLRRHHEFHAG
jgi:hypothetical protein